MSGLILLHPAAAGFKTARGAALFITRCRISLAVEDGDVAAAEMLMLLRDNLLDVWGEPPRLDVLQMIAFLGLEWAVCERVSKRPMASEDDEWETERESWSARIEAARAMWRNMSPSREEVRAVKATLTPYVGWPMQRPRIASPLALPAAA